VHVKDLDSTNGTFVNGKRIRTAELKAGDTLRVGRVELILSRAGSAAL
jgi:pSer/pThr/pTyr-binding forkhead associated (FHA) protein